MNTPFSRPETLSALLLPLLLACPEPERELFCPEPDFVEPPEIPGFELVELGNFHCGGMTHDVPVYLHGATGLEFVLVPGGTFTMGVREGEASERGHDLPRREVAVEPFLLARTEVSNGLFRAWKPEYTSGRIVGIDLDADELPAGLIRWTDAVAWCEAQGLRLPSEAEWEYACRAGTDTARFWGDGEEEAGRYANVADRALERGSPEFASFGPTIRDWEFADTDDGFVGPAPSGSLAPNAFGLFDMLGNVDEHCADPWHESYDGAPLTGRVWEEDGTGSRVNRGGSWDNPLHIVRSARRGVSLTKTGTAGLRPAMSLPR